MESSKIDIVRKGSRNKEVDRSGRLSENQWVTLIGFADVIALVVQEKNEVLLMNLVNRSLQELRMAWKFSSSSWYLRKQKPSFW